MPRDFVRRRRVMVIGLDGATFDLIKPWVKEGRLPTFKKLLDEGAHTTLTSTIPFATIPAWPSFATGCNPAKHGFYDFFKERDNSYDLAVEMFPSRAIRRPTLWAILSSYHKKVGIINVPCTYPPSKVNGYMLTGMLTPPGAKFTYPAEFKQELEQKIGKYRTFFSALSAKDPQILVKDMEETLAQRVRATQYLWKEKRTDFLTMVDNGTDRAEHELWRFLDSSNPLHNPEEVKRFANPLLKYYQTVDKALAEIVELLDENTSLIIMSDHGQGSLRKLLNPNLFLIEQGYMVAKEVALSKLRHFLFRHGYCPRSLYVALRKLGVERYATDRVSQRTRLSLLNRFFFSTADIDWAKTKAFASGICGGIRINVQGRQPLGTVKTGKEYEDLRDEIAHKLSEWRDPDTGEAVIENIYKREEIYHGPFLDKAPDIIAIRKDFYDFFNMYGFFSNKAVDRTFGNSGCHSPNGILIALGNEINKGIELNGANIVDIAPTILHIMGIPIPEDIDGKVLLEMFSVDSELANEKDHHDEVHYEREKLKGRIRHLKESHRI